VAARRSWLSAAAVLDEGDAALDRVGAFLDGKLV
jgi:hypothetical protein